MISAVILALHVIAAAYAFISRKREGGTGEGLLAVAFFGIIFTVGWTIMTMVTSLFLAPEGIVTWLNRDALTLLLLTIAEGFFYYFLLQSKSRSKNDGKGNGSAGTTST